MRRFLAWVACACASDQNLLRQPPDVAATSGLERVVDRFVQAEILAADVLFVVDNSPSMAEEQALMAENFPSMFAWLAASTVDWHLGVISTDLEAGQGRLVSALGGIRWIEPTTPDGEARFAEMVSLGTGGSGFEQGRATAYAALVDQADTHNEGFQRPDAGLHLVFVSDENDGSASPTRAEWIEYLDIARPDPSQVTASSIVAPLIGCADASPGTEYQAVTEAVGGVWWPICQEPWADVFDLLGRNVLGLIGEYFLSHAPAREEFDVKLTSEGSTATLVPVVDYAYDPARNSIVLVGDAPPAGSVVEVAYLAEGP